MYGVGVQLATVTLVIEVLYTGLELEIGSLFYNCCKRKPELFIYEHPPIHRS